MHLSSQRAAIALAAASLTLNIWQGLQIRALRSTPGPYEPVEVGTDVPPLQAANAEGRLQTIDFANQSKPTVLYVFRAGCGWCMRNKQAAEALMTGLNEQYRVVTLSLLPRGLAGEELVALDGARTLYEPDGNFVRKIKLSVTPQTIVIGTDGTIVKNWLGAYSGAVAAEVGNYFTVALPGLTALPSAGTE